MMSTSSKQPLSELRKRHFREIVEYALERVSTGGSRASQRQLAERIMCAPGMIRRYLDQETSVEGLKFLTLYSLSKACRLDPGSLFLWIEEGKDAAMAHEAALNGTMPPYGALDLAKRLVTILEEDGDDDGKSDAPGTPKPSLDGIRVRLSSLEQEVGHLYGRMLRLTGAEDVVDRVLTGLDSPYKLNAQDWSTLAALLEVEAAELMQEAGLAQAAVSSPAA